MNRLLFGLFLLVNVSGLSQTLAIYDLPDGIPAAPDYELFVNGKKVFVHNTRSAAYATFSFEGKIEIKVKSGAAIHTYDIRPSSKNIQATVYRNELHFNLTKPCNISIEINKNIKRPLFIFANPRENNVPDRNDKNVLFFESGKLHKPGIMKVKTGQAVYIEGGAVVQGSFIVEKARNVRIAGRGIIDNSHYQRGEARPVEINQSENVTVSGIVLAESRHWSCGSYGSKNVLYDNLKIVSDNDWDDGIDIVGSKNILVQNCFIRTKDDCIAVKSGVGYFTPFETGYTVDSVLVKESVLWNGVWGNAMEIGFETRTDTIRNVSFIDCDVIHVEGPEGVFTIHNGDRALIENIRYENIRVENASGFLIDFKILESRYSKDKKRGRIRNVHFRNITVEGNHYPSSVLIGFGEGNMISGVVIDNVVIHGKKIMNDYDAMLTRKYAEDITYK